MLWWLAETTVVAAALAGAVGLLCRRLRPRPAVRHALWLIVLLKLLTPPLVAWPWPAPALPPEPPRPPPPERLAEAPPAEPMPLLAPEAPVEVLPVEGPAWEARAEPAPEPVAPAVAAPPVAPPGIAWGQVIAGAWVAGAVLAALVQLVRIVRFRRRAACEAPPPPALLAAVCELAARLGVRPPAVRVVAGLASPVVWGLGPPRLLWPAALLGRLSADSERAAIVHELAHLRRRDHWVGWLQLIASCLWWWSPLYWHVRRQIGRAAELACDAWVIETLPQARRAYAEALLEVCELVSRRAAPAPALGMGGDRLEIERRLTMILRESVPSRAPVRALFGVVLLALIALPGLTDGQDSPARNRTTADPTSKDAAPVAGQGTPAAVVDPREQRLQKLEASLEALLKEVKELRGATAKPPTTGAAKPAEAWKTELRPITVHNVPVEVRWTEIKHAPTPSQPIRLVRTTYTLPKDKADALAALLKDLKAPVLETLVKADGIVVTTTPDVDRVIGEFVSLLQGNVPPATPKTGYNVPLYGTQPAK